MRLVFYSIIFLVLVSGSTFLIGVSEAKDTSLSASSADKSTTGKTQLNRQKQIKARVEKAFDYMRVKPQMTLDMVRELEAELHDVSEEMQLDVYLAGIWSGVYLSDKRITAHYSKKALAFLDLPDEDHRHHRIINAISANLWRQNDNKHARLFAACGLQHAMSARRQLSSLSLLGATSRELDSSYAEKVYRTGMSLAKKHNERRFLAAFNNNMGVVSLGKEDFSMAEEYFTTALDIRHEIDHMPGQVTSGTNLMLTFFMQKKWDYFMRLSQRVEVKLKNHSSKMYRNYYGWLIKAWQVQQKPYISDEEREELVQIYIDIDQSGVQSFIREAAKTIDLSMPEIAKPNELQGAQMLELFPICDWQKYQNMKVEELLAGINRV